MPRGLEKSTCGLRLAREHAGHQFSSVGGKPTRPPDYVILEHPFTQGVTQDVQDMAGSREARHLVGEVTSCGVSEGVKGLGLLNAPGQLSCGSLLSAALSSLPHLVLPPCEAVRGLTGSFTAIPAR